MKFRNLIEKSKAGWKRTAVLLGLVGLLCGAIVGPSDVVAFVKDPFGFKAARQANEDRRTAEDERRRAEKERRQAAEERRQADERHEELGRMVSEGRATLRAKYPAGYVALYTDGLRVYEDFSNRGATVLIEPQTARIRSVTDETVSLDFQIRHGGLLFKHENNSFPRRIGEKINFLGIGHTLLTAEVIAVYGGEIAIVIGAREN